ncbi:MAG TPA: helical backbone metal receptor [Spirochaetota bacterium]|nr:helical backbone metal receptor [Spirochaetota bacterium]
MRRQFIMRAALCAGSVGLLAALAAGGGEVRRAGAVPGKVSRVVSLSPSITRQVVDLGAEDSLAGVTNYHPAMQKNVPVVSSIVLPNIELIFSLRPDAVLLSGSDVIAAHAPRMEALGLAVRRFGKNEGFDDIIANYRELAALLGKGREAEGKIESYRRELGSIRKARGARCAFFVSHGPIVAAGGKSFIGAVIRDAGGSNVYGGIDIAYPIVSLETIVERDPDVIISMMPGAAEFFAKAPEEVPGVKALRGRVFSVGDEHLPYYTPRDYLASVRAVAEILRNAEGGR